MPISLELVEDGHILYYVYSDPWTVEDLTSLTPRVMDYYNQASHKIHTLGDATKLRQVPPGALRVRSVPNLSHPNSGDIAIAGASLLVETISTTIFRLVHFNRVKFFQNADEAWAYLRTVIAEEAVTKAATRS